MYVSVIFMFCKKKETILGTRGVTSLCCNISTISTNVLHVCYPSRYSTVLTLLLLVHILFIMSFGHPALSVCTEGSLHWSGWVERSVWGGGHSHTYTHSIRLGTIGWLGVGGYKWCDAP
jgi:hypothetical protein